MTTCRPAARSPQSNVFYGDHLERCFITLCEKVNYRSGDVEQCCVTFIKAMHQRNGCPEGCQMMTSVERMVYESTRLRNVHSFQSCKHFKTLFPTELCLFTCRSVCT